MVETPIAIQLKAFSSFYFSFKLRRFWQTVGMFLNSLSASTFSHDEGAREDYLVLKHKSAIIISVLVILGTTAQQW